VLHSDDGVYYQNVARHGSQASLIVSVSNRIRKTLAFRQDAPSVPGKVIPCGICLGETPTARAVDEKIELIWVGRYEERQKRVGDLPKILSGARASGGDFRLRIVGAAGTPAQVEPFAAVGVESAVRFLPWLDREGVQSALRKSDVLLLPSNFEGWPRVVMEALACGCGVVASRVSGVEDFENDSRAAGCLWLHSVGNVSQAVERVLEAASVDPSIRVSRARALAEAELSIEECVKEYAQAASQLRVSAARAPRVRDMLRGLAALGTSPVIAGARSAKRSLEGFSRERLPTLR
jgi:glycosyltransferase involved in cell wall biosynthesis